MSLQSSPTTPREITVAHSPDSDDAFMFYALARHKVQSPTLAFRHHLNDIETLNRQAMEGRWDVTAISFHAFPQISDRYCLLPCGGSLGDGYGPIVVSRDVLQPEELRSRKIAVPGTLTTAYLVMKIYQPEFEAVIVPFDKILDAVKEGRAEAGLLIHEGQLTFERDGLHCVVDLGRWWKDQFDLPLPLGGNVIRRDLPAAVRQEAAQLLRRSVEYALEHRREAMEYALQFARDLETELADRFVGMYVNDYTIDYGTRGRQAIETLFRLGYEKGIIARKPPIEF
ncbi:MAG: ABC transporter substrate-binding protein [Acidobacteria bacterium]|nr:ABC transporter substrate-binding protein [Acidobacteriota bacterium]